MSRERSNVHINLSFDLCVKLYTGFKPEKQNFRGGDEQMRWLVVSGAALLLTVWCVWAQQEQKEQPPDTGLKVGDFVPAYNPIHVAGPDKGTNTCPV